MACAEFVGDVFGADEADDAGEKSGEDEEEQLREMAVWAVRWAKPKRRARAAEVEAMARVGFFGVGDGASSPGAGLILSGEGLC